MTQQHTSGHQALHGVFGAALALVMAMSLLLIGEEPVAAADTWCGTDGATVCRVSGSGRVETAVQVSEQYWDSSRHAVLATARDFPDALAGAVLANRLGAPLLLTEPHRLPTAVATELARLEVGTVTILGGRGAVSQAVEDALADAGIEVGRMQGSNRFATAAAIADAAGPSSTGEVVLALGQHATPASAWPDAVASGALAATPDRVPTLLTRPTDLPIETESALAALRPRTVILVGGPNAVSGAVEQRVAELGYDVRRLAGASRYETSAIVAAEALQRFPDGDRPVVYATGRSFPDALSAAALAGRLEATLLLVPPTQLPTDTTWLALVDDAAAGIGGGGGVVVGGSGAVSDSVVSALASRNSRTPAAPSITLSSTSGAVGTSVSVAGTGFPKHETAAIRLGTAEVARARTSGAGSFSTSFTVGDVAAGQTTVMAAAGKEQVTHEFTVSAPLSPWPRIVPDLAPEPAPAPVPVSADAYQRRVRAELKVFTDWLAANGEKGYVGEVSWPNSYPEDMDRYNALAESWFADADAAGLWASTWAAGEWWKPDYKMSVYVRQTGERALTTPRPQAAVIERHPSTAAYSRGVNLNGGEFGAGGNIGIGSGGSFSNANPGVYDQAWHYDSQATMDFLASRGHKHVRILFRWERLQPVPGGPLNATELQRIKAAIGRAHAAGLEAIPSVANYGAYWLDDGTKGVRRPIGSAQIPVSHFTGFWRQLSSELKGTPGVAGYLLMVEPVGMPGATRRDEAALWERTSQAAVDAIRANGDTTQIFVPGYHYSGVQRWSTHHPRPWITDPADNYLYEAHHYWSSNNDGNYKTYDEELAIATARGY